MASRQRKSGAPRKNIPPIASYNLGDLVLAKHGEHPYWPAEIRKCSQRPHAYQWKREDEQMLWCEFINEDCGAFVHIAWVKHYEPNIAKRWQCRKGPYSKSQPAAISFANDIYQRRTSRPPTEPNTPPPEPVVESDNDNQSNDSDSDCSNDTYSSAEFQPNPTPPSTPNTRSRTRAGTARGLRGRGRGRGRGRARGKHEFPSSNPALLQPSPAAPPASVESNPNSEIARKNTDSADTTAEPRKHVQVDNNVNQIAAPAAQPPKSASTLGLPALLSHLAAVQSVGIVTTTAPATLNPLLNHLPTSRVKPSDVKPSDIDLLLHPTKCAANFTNPTNHFATPESHNNSPPTDPNSFQSQHAIQSSSNLKRASSDNEAISLNNPAQRKRSRFAPAPPSVLDQATENVRPKSSRATSGRRRWTDAEVSVPSPLPPAVLGRVPALGMPWTVQGSARSTTTPKFAPSSLPRWKPLGAAPAFIPINNAPRNRSSLRDKIPRFQETILDQAYVPTNGRSRNQPNRWRHATSQAQTQTQNVSVDPNSPNEHTIIKYLAVHPMDHSMERRKVMPEQGEKSSARVLAVEAKDRGIPSPFVQKATTSATGSVVQKTEPMLQSITPTLKSSKSIVTTHEKANHDLAASLVASIAIPKPVMNTSNVTGTTTNDSKATNGMSSKSNGTASEVICIGDGNSRNPSLSTSTALTASSPQASTLKPTDAAGLLRAKITELDNMDKIAKVDVLKLKWMTLGTVKDDDAKEILPALFDKLKSVVGTPAEAKQHLSELRIIIEGVLTSDNL